MSVNIRFDPTSPLCEIHIQGVLSRSGFSAAETELASHIEAGNNPRLLVVLEDFAGWEEGADWNNLDFMFTHGTKIAKIAIVGDKRWEGEVKMFTGAGMRAAPVGYFEPDRLVEARDWVLG